MIGDLNRATWGNIEAQGIDFVVYTLRPWLIRIEQAMETRFRLDSNMEIRHVVEGLLRGDSAARSAFYHNAILDGWMNRNEARVLEDLNPEPGLDEFLTPSNEVPTQSPKGANGEDKALKATKEAIQRAAAKLSPKERSELLEVLKADDLRAIDKALMMLLEANPHLRNSILEALGVSHA
jgi:hypothetical protein